MELTSEQLTILLNSRDGRKCNRATKYLFKRGTKSLNFLLTLQGNEEFFAGSCIENPYSAFSSSFLFPKEVYESGARTTPIEEDKERAVTVEVAALYLISSIYYGRLTCACNALLMDLSLPKSEQKMANKKAYLLRGFQAAQEWVQKCQRVGIQTLRKHGERPLNSVKLYWYGSRSDPISCEVEIIPAKPIQWNWKTIVSHYNGLIQQNQSDTIETREWGKTHDMEEEDFLKMDQRYEILRYDHVDVSISIDDNSTVDDEFEWLSRFQPIGKDIELKKLASLWKSLDFSIRVVTSNWNSDKSSFIAFVMTLASMVEGHLIIHPSELEIASGLYSLSEYKAHCFN